MKHHIRRLLKPFVLELIVYAILVTLYNILVLHFLGNHLLHIYQHDRRIYSVLALGLIVGQGFLLETFTRLLLGWITLRTEDG